MTSGIVECLVQHQAVRQATGIVIARSIAAADLEEGACFELGVAYSTGGDGVERDLIEAHMWFNLAAASGYEEAANCRAEIAGEMTAREIAEAQRRARRWLATHQRRAA